MKEIFIDVVIKGKYRIGTERFKIDTGATYGIISRDVASSLQLTPVPFYKIRMMTTDGIVRDFECLCNNSNRKQRNRYIFNVRSGHPADSVTLRGLPIFRLSPILHLEDSGTTYIVIRCITQVFIKFMFDNNFVEIVDHKNALGLVPLRMLKAKINTVTGKIEFLR